MESFNPFGFDHHRVEEQVELAPEFYPKLALEALYTSVDDLEAIFSQACVSGTWVDLGAGVGNTVLTYAQKFPERRAIGIEHSQARAEAGKAKIIELGLLNAELICEDLLTASIPEGMTYFLYFPTGHVLDRILSELSFKKRTFKLVVIESHGDLIKRIQMENWLLKVGEIPLMSERHFPSAIIFQATNAIREKSLWMQDLSFKKKILVIREGERLWIGESFGLSLHQERGFNLEAPPRTIDREQIERVLEPEDLDAHVQLSVRLRRLGSLTFKTAGKVYDGTIRKIYLLPTFSLELSSGETIEWSEIIDIKQGHQLCYESFS